MKDNGQAWVPTIFAYTYLYEVCVKNMDAHKETAFNDPVMAKEMRDFQFFEPAYLAYRDHFKDLYDTGVTICAGTDMVLYQAPVLPLSTELGLMVQYGITPLQAIQTATSNSAKVLGIEDEVGVLKKGYLADVLVVNGDVSRDIACISDVENVYQNGKIVF
ncbi:MAG: amidohydrolase family protein [Lachnospiraceae bacterium]